MSNSIIKEYDLSFKNLDNTEFTISLYQRRYAWGEDEVLQLLNDLKNFYIKEKDLGEKYFIGNIVVEKKSGSYHIIDGQQRFTTLYLIAKLLNENYFNLSYEIREDDKKFLEEFNKDNYKDKQSSLQFKINIETILKFQDEFNKLEDLLKLCQFTITFLPKSIDIVKYFEVMNNRGKQLEKHQILKAKFLSILEYSEDSNKIDWAKIWDYCSNMNVYIEDSIYYGDLKSDEKALNNVRNSFKKLLEENEIPQWLQKQNTTDFISINDIINPQKESQDNLNTYNENFYVRQEYHSILKFQIFLIQILKIYFSQKDKDIKEIVVNDRYLIEYYTNNNELIFDKREAKDFLILLLKMRILYDYFIFKRDEKEQPFLDVFGIEKEVLFLKEDNNKINNLLMLQLLFNFTSPQYFTQDWIAPTLQWIHGKNIFEDNFYENYKNFLENFDKELSRTRLNKKNITDFINSKLTKNNEIDNEVADFNNILNLGTSTPHYWFYKLDYLLWKDYNNEKKVWKDIKILNNIDVKTFKLSRLNSIEHIQPQHPENDCDNWNNEECNIDNFGNLALISNHMNSSLSNQCFKYKIEDIKKQLKRETIESLKILLIYSKYERWNEQNCCYHQEEMIKILKESLK